MKTQKRELLRELQNERFGPPPIKEKAPSPTERRRQLEQAMTGRDTTPARAC